VAETSATELWSCCDNSLEWQTETPLLQNHINSVSKTERKEQEIFMPQGHIFSYVFLELKLN